MTGSEVGLRPPLPPRNVDSRVSTAFLHQESSSNLILGATERFRTGNEALFAAVRGELGQTHHFVPSVKLPQDPNQQVTLGIASANDRKFEDMLAVATTHKLYTIRIPEAQELHTKNSIMDATSKAVDAADFLRARVDENDTLRRDVRNRPHVTIATDVLNAIPVIVEDPVTHLQTIQFERVGKPINEDVDPTASIRSRFEQLAFTAYTFGWSTIPYITELATVIHNPDDPNNNAVSVQKSVIFLSVEGMQQLATDRFDEYIERVSKQFDILQIAGGLELQILEDMGYIQLITGTQSEVTTDSFPPAQRLEAKEHAYRLALGNADKELVKEYLGIKQK